MVNIQLNPSLFRDVGHDVVRQSECGIGIMCSGFVMPETAAVSECSHDVSRGATTSLTRAHYKQASSNGNGFYCMFTVHEPFARGAHVK